MFSKELETKNMNKSLDNIKKVFDHLKTINNFNLIPKVIHIAGTNGKGSTLAFLKSILNKHGYIVHRYTSPHIKNWEERIEIRNETVSTDILKETIKICELAAKKLEVNLSIFEILTLCAFILFSRNKADFSLIETGVGGRLDATNILDESLYAASIISSISMDHTEVLGDTLEKIAYEKAFITKKNIPFICSKSTLNLLPSSLDKSCGFLSDMEINFELSLKGEHQKENAALALKTLEAIGIKLDEKITKQALADTVWIGRMENRGGVIFDGAHNIGGAHALLKYLKSIEFKKYTAIIGMKKRKDIKSFLSILSESLEYVICLKIGNDSYEEIEIKNVAKSLNIKAITADSFQSAIKIAKKLGLKTIVTGSLELMQNNL